MKHDLKNTQMRTTTKQQQARRLIVLKAGEMLCKNPACRKVFTPSKPNQERCSPACEQQYLNEDINLRGAAARGRKKQKP